MNSNNVSSLGQSTRFDNSSKLSDYNDLSGLQSIKHQAKTDKEGALDAVAKQFESIFVSMMIKSMRDANKGFSEGNLLQSSESDSYQQMFDSQLAVTLSTDKGIGLADVIKRQLSKSTLGVDSGNEPKSFELNKSYNIDGYNRRSLSPRLSNDEMQRAIAKVDNSLQEMTNLSLSDMTEQSAQAKDPLLTPKGKIDFSSPDSFIQSLYPYAKSVEQETGIDARLMLAQSALETGWGKHQIMKEDGSPSFNLFGIKAQQGWSGDSAKITTTEYRGGLAMKEQASFRSYDSYGESFKDYAKFLQGNDRYQTALEQVSDPKEFAIALQNSGYATDPNYATKINSIMDRYLDDVSSGRPTENSRNEEQVTSSNGGN
jgi:flagellar protein FlgJ